MKNIVDKLDQKKPSLWGCFSRGNYLPGIVQKQIAEEKGDHPLKYSIVGITGMILYQAPKIYAVSFLLKDTSLENLYGTIKKAGVGGMCLWTAWGLIETGIRVYILTKKKKPIGLLSVEGIRLSIKKIKKIL